MNLQTKIHQRADLTFKHNRGLWRHGWLRLTPAYSVKIVDEILAEKSNAHRVFDPFCGTATTPLCANDYGFYGCATDINPFLVWFGNAKLRHYSEADIEEARESVTSILDGISKVNIEPSQCPPIHNIERWWSNPALEFLQMVKGGIDNILSHEKPAHDLLSIIFCRTLIEISNAAFNHQSMSFKDAELTLFTSAPSDHYQTVFTNVASEIIQSASQNPNGDGEVLLCDARQLETLGQGDFDLLVTSPPYPNRMSYIRELRPYMYWLGFLSDSRSAGELDWQAIGGTWGIATSRVTKWTRDSSVGLPNELVEALPMIKDAHQKNGITLSNYVAKYFEDLSAHFASVKSVMQKGAEVHYVIGNSTFYNILIPSDVIYEKMLKNSGFSNVSSKTIRKRNSKKELYEYLVSGTA